MTLNPYGGGSSGKGFTLGGASSSAPKTHHSHGIFGLAENLGKDIKDSALGLPQGLVQLAEHPIHSLELAGKMTWQTYSPLFHGHPVKFAQGVYDHPLAPLLDVLTVFTGGAGAAAKLGGKLAEAGIIDESSGLARLGKAGKITLDGEHGKLTKYTSENPLHRYGQNKVFELMKAVDKHLPKWSAVAGTEGMYRRLHLAESAHREAAMNLQIAGMLQAGKSLDEIGKLPALEATLFSHNFFNLLRHAKTIKAGEPLPDGWTYVRSYLPKYQGKFFYENAPSKDFAMFQRRVRNFGRRYTTNHLPEAATARGGKLVKIVQVRDLKALGLEADRSATFLRKLYRTPTSMWKTILLGYSPRVVINNGVGNWFMYAMRQSGAHGFRGFVDAVRYTRGERKAAQLLKQTGKLSTPHWLKTYFADELGNVFGKTTLEGGGKLRQGLYPVVHHLADAPVRAAAISAFMRGAPEVRALMKRKGLSFDDAAREALRRNSDLRARAALHARKIAGDYFTMSPAERIMRDFIPFYLWDKHIVKHVGDLALEKPGRLALAQAIGKQGTEKTLKELGDIPDFMLGLIPFGHSGGRTKALSTIGLNPYSTIPELYDFAQALTAGHVKPGEAVGAQINPLIQQFIEQASGHRLTSDSAPARHGGLIPSILAGTAESLPVTQLLEKATGHSFKPTTPTLYSHDLEEILSSLGGVPVKKVNEGRAHALAAQERGSGKKKRKKKTVSGFTLGG